jgi:hypothetical protein
MTAAAPRLAGIRFETVRPQPAPGLPRMDVAAFAGFAATGPVGLPVAVEDVVRFEEVFGGDLPLAWNRARGATEYALLGPAVRAFFGNGGRRCWVLRLAQGARTARFVVPGLLRAGEGAVRGAAVVQAASPGSWADDVRVNATLLRRGLAEAACVRVPEGFRLLDPAERDLLRLDYPHTRTVAFVPPAPAGPGGADLPRKEREAQALRRPRDGHWFRQALPGGLPAGLPLALRFLGAGGERPLTRLDHAFAETARVAVPAGEAEGIRPGTWLRLEAPGAASFPFAPDSYLLVDAVDRGEVRAEIVARRAWRRLDAESAWAQADGEPFLASLVSAELWARRAGRPEVRFAGAGLAPDHPRGLDSLPADDWLYAPAERLMETPLPPMAAAVERPRLPLAALPGAAAARESFLPLGLEPLVRDDADQPARVDDEPALTRDGLAAFDDDLFLDPALASVPAETLLETAFQLQYQAEPGRPPCALHALLPGAEASMVALPDAVHAGWTLAEAPDDDLRPPTAPGSLSASGPYAEGRIEAAWDAVPGAHAYLLEDSADPRFRAGVRALRTPRTRAELSRPEPCGERLHLRVRAVGAGGGGPWSASRRVELRRHPFDRCGRPDPEAPVLDAPAEAGPRLALAWSGAGERFRVERADDPGFGAGEVVYQGPARSCEVWKPAAETYFRVAAAVGGEEGPWSEARRFAPPAGPRWETADPLEPEAAGRLLRVHAALLRMCAARADAVAVLALPRAYREDDALSHAAALRAALGGSGARPEDAGARVLTYGALYHPWTVVRDPRPGAALRAVPPDGAACGVLATRAIASGAWAAPANRPLHGVLALEPALGEAAPALFLDRGVNALAPAPEGFSVMSEETLGDGPALAGVGVRRLLILLRRLVLREGNRYVFQPNDASFRRLVQRQFDGVLADLFMRGAFAGARPAEGYRVVADDTVNPRGSVDQGRLVVELRVAPSRPLHFLTVRLLQSGAGLTVRER